MKKLISIICISTALLSCSACRTAPPVTAAGELAAHRWRVQNLSGQLIFKEKNMTLDLSDGENKLSLSGEYFADEKRLTFVTAEQTTIIFSYVLEGEKLLLTYGGKTMTFIKDDEKNDPAAEAAESK